MFADRSQVIVGVDDSPGAEAALTWAIADARSRHAVLRPICAYRWPVSYESIAVYGDAPISNPQPREVAEQVVAKAASRATELDVEARGEAVDGEGAPVLLNESSRAAIVVLGSRHLKALGSSVLGSVSARVAAHAACPTVVVRGPAGLPGEDPAVVVGVDATEASGPVLEFAFDHASRHHIPLRAVLCWHPDLLASMMWRLEPPPPTRAQLWLSEALAGWREKYPDVVVHSAVIKDHPVSGLVAASAAQHLLVVGSHGRRALAGTLLGSVSQGVLHHATCPVVLVPTHTD